MYFENAEDHTCKFHLVTLFDCRSLGIQAQTRIGFKDLSYLLLSTNDCDLIDSDESNSSQIPSQSRCGNCLSTRSNGAKSLNP
jgi:hypothetical protein